MKTTEHLKLKVVIRNLSDHPHCKNHGPALLFQKRIVQTDESHQKSEKYHEFYACSAVRDKNECPVIGNITKQNQLDLITKFNNKCHNNKKILAEILNEKDSKHRGYCGQCKTLIKYSDFNKHENHLNFQQEVTNYQIKCPTTLLPPLDNDQKEAQYFFSIQTVECLTKIIKKLNFKKIICIGAPRLHEFIQFNKTNLQIDSILLDLDERLQLFYAEHNRHDEFYLYNMFNNYFLDGKYCEDKFKQFLLDTTGGQICLFTDPPFGCRTEPLVQTIKTITQWYQQVNNFSHHFLSSIWIFPYFMEQYIRNEMPEMEMSAYKINYTNHKLYHNRNNGRLEGSPIRLFTNISLDQIELSTEELYWWCKKCKQWRGNEDKHCNLCEICPSKNGSSYVHCFQCSMCVKPNYRHCINCERCTQVQGHSCELYQQHLTCWICHEKGHTESKCLRWINGTINGKKIFNKYKKLFNNKSGRLKKKMCLICGCLGKHNELLCPERCELLSEKRFCNEIFNIFSK